jgi:type I restriction enzyme S subunit
VADLKPYPRMKCSGVPWLGEVPEHWKVMPLKRVTLARCDGPFGSGLKSSHYTDTGIRVIRLQNIGHAEFRESDAAFISPTYCASLGDHSVLANDLLIAGLGDDRHPTGRACVAPTQIEPAMVKADCFRFRLDTSQVVPHFAARHLTATAETASAALSTGATRQRTNLESTSTRAIALPSVSEQVSIVRFLDNASRHIRRYIRSKQKLIKLLEEHKQAIIHRAVTRGLDPNVRLKPSRVEWLGDVPQHWEVRKLKYLVNTVAGIQMGPFGASLTELQDHDTGFKLFGQENTISGDFQRGGRWLAQSQFRDLRRYELLAGDLVLTRKGSIGKCRMVPQGSGQGIADSDTIRVRLNGALVSRRFIMMLLHESPYVQQQIHSVQRGAVLGGLNTSTIAGLRIAVPPMAEQKRLLDRIDRETSGLHCSIAAVNRQISVLREYHTHLIADVVTGKVDVREVAARLPDEAEEPESLDAIDAFTDGQENAADDLVPEEAEA